MKNGIRLMTPEEHTEHPHATHMMACGPTWVPIKFVEAVKRLTPQGYPW